MHNHAWGKAWGSAWGAAWGRSQYVGSVAVAYRIDRTKPIEHTNRPRARREGELLLLKPWIL